MEILIVWVINFHEAEGWVRNINSQAVQTQLSAYQNSGNSTVGDVLGTKTVQIDPLPYKITARSQQVSTIYDREAWLPSRPHSCRRA